MRGTLLNAVCVAVGAAIGLLVRSSAPEALMSVALQGLGLVTMGIGFKMFLEGKNVLIVAFSVAIGGVVGHLLGIQEGLGQLADWAKTSAGSLGTGRFQEALVTTTVLFCVGPMTLLGCLEDALENKIDLLALKSVMDGISSVFFAALLGPGVLVTAVVVLVFQGMLTLLARYLKPVADNPALLSEIVATGGALMIAIGLGLAEIVRIPAATYLPALVLAAVLAAVVQRMPKAPAVS